GSSKVPDQMVEGFWGLISSAHIDLLPRDVKDQCSPPSVVFQTPVAETVPANAVAYATCGLDGSMTIFGISHDPPGFTRRHEIPWLIDLEICPFPEPAYRISALSGRTASPQRP